MSCLSRWSGRLAAIAVGTLFSLVLLEALLQGGALVLRFVAPRNQPAGAAALVGTRRVLALGDSNTYGLYVERDQAFPQVLQRLWNTSGQTQPIEVINLGFPGTNSSTVRKNLPGLLRRVRPDQVIVLIGVNDLWTMPGPTDPDVAGRGFDPRGLLYRWSRLYRLWFMRTRSFELPVLEGNYSLEHPLGFEARHVRVDEGGESFEFGFDPAGGRVEDWERILSDNLESIVATTAGFGAELVLLTYLSEQTPYGVTNNALRRFAASHLLRLIDSGAELLPTCPEGRCLELLSDQHPSAAGYELVARSLLRDLGGPP